MGLLTSLLGQQPGGATMGGFGLPPMGATGSPMQMPQMGGQNAGLLGQLLFGGQNGGLMAQMNPQMQNGLLGLLMPQYFGPQSSAQPNIGTGAPVQLPGAMPQAQGLMGGNNTLGVGGYYGAGPSGPVGMSGGAGVGQQIAQPHWGVPQGWQSPLAQYGGQRPQGL